MTRDVYDFLTPPGMPKGLHTTVYYFPHQQYKSTAIPPTGPAFRDPPCMAVHYDKDGNLLLTRFIFEDGSFKDCM
jgi:hypothetical protein